ncbi:PadR family transcriptional regulator [Paenibacillus cymbidii]|uniref:PadR family transcriptional regulator n=1 Tax=Paenibacillus cymbidii TaxID=1639034 RepID=UPI0010806644|nr:PadR family transcriptional regulator [Paenibacillus cymbidii]
MSIKYAILGLLSWKPLTGYEIKKLMEDSIILYWSGNNNQIYKSLVQLHEEDLVTTEVQHQQNAPSRKIYTITASGLSALKQWTLSAPEAPEYKKAFFVQLAWSHQQSNEETDQLLSEYEQELSLRLAYQQEKHARRNGYPDRDQREKLLWNTMAQNVIASIENELRWIDLVRRELAAVGWGK